MQVDISKMNDCCKCLIGEHDFSSFCCANSSTKTTVRTIYKANFTQKGNYITFEVTGNGFLYNMVRILVGTLIEVGRNKISKQDFINLLNQNNRAKQAKQLSQTAYI